MSFQPLQSRRCCEASVISLSDRACRCLLVGVRMAPPVDNVFINRTTEGSLVLDV